MTPPQGWAHLDLKRKEKKKSKKKKEVKKVEFSGGVGSNSRILQLVSPLKVFTVLFLALRLFPPHCQRKQC